MGDVPAEFMDRLPLHDWVEQACLFADASGETGGSDIWECIREGPQSPDPRKYLYVRDAHADTLVAMCNVLRAFNNFRDSQMLSVSFRRMVEARRSVGKQPRFRLNRHSRL